MNDNPDYDTSPIHHETSPKMKKKFETYRSKVARRLKFIKLLPKVIQLIRPCIVTLFFAYFFKLITAGLNIRKAKYIANLGDVTTGNRSIFDLKDILIDLTVCFAIFKALNYAYAYLNGRIIRTLNKEVKANLYRNILEKDVEFFDRYKPYQAVDMINQGIEAVQTLVTSRLSGTINPFLKAVGTLALLSSTSKEMTFIVLAITPFLIYAQNQKYHEKFSKKNKEHALQIATKETEIPSFSKQRLLLIKSFSTEQRELQHFIEKAHQCVIPSPNASGNFWKVKILKSFIFRIFQTVLTAYGIILMFRERLSFGELLAFNLYFTEFINSITSTLANFKALLKSLVKSDQLFKVLEYEPHIKAHKGSHSSIRGSVTVRRIDFAYPTKPTVKVIEGVSLDIKAGESVAFVGPDGSGKSTLVKLIMRLYDVADGKIFIGGENIKNYDVKWLHENIGYVPEEPALIDGTIEENLLYGLENYEGVDLEKYVLQAKAGFLLDKRRYPEGLETKVGEKGVELSVSEKQRICIARALMRNPKILILDELTKGLSENEDGGELQKAIDDVINLKDKTVIVTAKNFESVRNCVKVYSLGEGKTLEGKSLL